MYRFKSDGTAVHPFGRIRYPPSEPEIDIVDFFDINIRDSNFPSSSGLELNIKRCLLAALDPWPSSSVLELVRSAGLTWLTVDVAWPASPARAVLGKDEISSSSSNVFLPSEPLHPPYLFYCIDRSFFPSCRWGIALSLNLRHTTLHCSAIHPSIRLRKVT